MSEAERTAQRIVMGSDGTIGIEDYQVGSPDSGEVLIATVCCLISAGTELGTIETRRGEKAPLGYSNVGRIIELGEGSDGFGYSVGDLVLSLENHATHVISSAEAHCLAPVPPGVSPEEAAFGVLGSVSMHSVHKATPAFGEHAAVSGMGVVGQLVLQLLSMTGSESLMAVDCVPSRLDLAKDSGASHILNFEIDEVEEAVESATGGLGLDLTIESSGYPEALVTAFDLARIGGRVVCLGSIWHREISIDFMDFHLKEITLMGCHQPKCPTCETPYYRWTQQHNRRQVLKMISDGRLDVKKLITHRLPFQEACEGYRHLMEEKDKALGVILNFDDS